MSDEYPEWWPAGYRDPAFQVQRKRYAAVEGGDYVRGSATTLPKTALRYPSVVPGVEEIAGKGILYCRPADYQTVELHWTVPTSLRETWAEVAIVRSVFGSPSTVMDGVTIYRKRKDALYPTGMPVDASGNPAIVPVFDLQDPKLRGDKPGLPSGQWYYYSVFFRVGPIDWVRGMSASCLLPKYYGHQSHLWNRIPPYYRWVDDNQREGEGYLHQFLRIFGFELDTTREYVEQYQKTYWIDRSPMRLLRRLGENFDVPYESGLGDIRYRAFLANLGFLYDTRGTQPCLEQVIEACSKYECEITGSTNLMILPDDSDFFGGTGNWAGLHPDADEDAIAADPDDTPPFPDITIVTPEEIRLSANEVGTAANPSNSGRGTMRMRTTKGTETTPVMLACGCGITSTASALHQEKVREVTPLLGGVPVRPGHQYGFTIQLTMQSPSPVRVMLLWFGKSGAPSDLVGVDSSDEVAPGAGWEVYTQQGIAPDDAVYLVPCVYFVTRLAGTDPEWSPTVDFAGAMVYDLGDSNSPVTTIAPDRYLRMGDPAETIGPTTPTHEGSLLGEPRSQREEGP